MHCASSSDDLNQIARLLLAVVLLLAPVRTLHAENDHAVTPFRIAGNLYSIGGADVTSFLITTPAGHIVIDGGYEEMAPAILANIRQLGFRVEDVRVLVCSHAHFDHVGGIAALKRATGAQFVASRGDAPLLERGGHDDPQFGDRFHFTALVPDRIIEDGQTVSVGDTTLTAHITPGHTPGCTTWTTSVRDGGKVYSVVFVGSPSVPSEYRLLENPRYPLAVADYRHTFEVLRSLHPDIFLGSHGGFFGFAEKMKTRNFVDPEGYRKFVDAMERAFEKHLAAEKPRPTS